MEAPSAPAGDPGGQPWLLAGGRYAVEAALGAGGGGEVVAARDTLLERAVAIKRLPLDALTAGHEAAAAAEAAARLLAEARALARLVHPHVVAVFDAFEEDGRLQVVMERVAGPTLRALLDARGPLPLDDLGRLAGHLAAALEHAHGQGIVHRDVKPANVLLAPAAPERPGGAATWTAKLGDFGLAVAPGRARLTLPGLAVGTPAYVAPEQALGQAVDGRADLYALGCLLYEAATGAPPFAGDDPLQVVSQHLHATPVPPAARRPDLPAAWDALLLRLLAKRPEDRVPSAAALLAELAELAALEAPAARAPAHNLPAPLTSFVGREHELADVARLLTGAPGAGDRNAPAADGVRPRLVTLTGPGGTGKTRLALQAAAGLLAEFPDGVWLVELAALADAALVPAALAQALALREAPGQALLATVVTFLRDRHLLLVLDNFEHLLGAAPIVTDLLAACHGLTVLATSRSALRLTGEQELPVPPLALPPADAVHGAPDLDQLLQYEAVALFVRRASASAPDFVLTAENAPAVAAICRRLDGLPLALELAAARAKLLPPQELLVRLERRLALLTGGPRDLPARQQTLRATLDWSYGLLSPGEQALLARLGVFAGGWTLAAAEAVGGPGPGAGGPSEGTAGPPVEPLDGLASLVNESLVERAPGAAGEARFRMLETVREYAAERLEQRGEAAAVRRRHGAHFLTLAERAEPEMFGPAQPEWLDRVERELPDLRAAVAWAVEQGDGGLGLRLVGALAWACQLRFWLSEGRAWLAAVLPEGRRPAGTPPSAALAKVLSLAGSLAGARGDLEAARARYGEARAVARAAGDDFQVTWAVNQLGAVAVQAGDLDRAGRLLAEALRRRRALGHAWGVATSLSDLGHVAVLRGDYAAARTRYEESLALRRAIGEPRNLAYATRNLGYVAALQGDLPRARALLEESAGRFRAGGFGELAVTLVLLGDVAAAEGDTAAARAALAESLDSALGRSDWLPEEQPGRVALALLGYARLAAAQGQAQRALRLAGAAAAVLDGVPRMPAYAWQTAHWRRWVERDLAALRPGLGEGAAGAAWAAGRALTLEAAVAEALAAPPPVTRGGRAAAPSRAPGGLTAREREVAVLVARGYSNPQLARELVIAPRTAGRHVEHVMAKLGVHSRAEVAAWAAQQGLLAPGAG